MKNVLKTLRIALVVLLVLVVAVVVLVHLFGNIALKTGIEAAATSTLNVGVSLGDLDLSILGGKVSLQNLIINNPPGYQHDKLLSLAKGRITVRLSSLLTDTVDIKDITLDGVDVVLEQRGITSNNLQDILSAIPKAKGEPAAGAKKTAKTLRVGTLEITNVTVKAKLLPIPGKADTVTIKLDPIRMTDLGDDGNLDTAKLSGKILLAIAAGVTKQGRGLLPKSMTGAMKTTLDEAAGLGKAAAEESKKLLETGKDAGEDIIEGFKGLFKPKK